MSNVDRRTILATGAVVKGVVKGDVVLRKLDGLPYMSIRIT